MLMLSMKRMSLALAAASLVGCSESVMSPEPLMPDAMALAKGADDGMVQEVLPFNLSWPVQCGDVNEVVDFTGELVMMTKVITTPDGGTKAFIKSQPRNVRGVGAVTGIVYRGVGMAQQMEHTAPAGTPYEYKWLEIARFIAPGPGNNLHMKTWVHQVIDADGQMVVNANESEVECR